MLRLKVILSLLFIISPNILFGSQWIEGRCVYSKPIFKPESLALIKIKDNSDRLSEVEFRGWMFASSPALNALENPVYDISVLACKNSVKQSKKSSSVEPIE